MGKAMTAIIIAAIALASGYAHYEYKAPGCNVEIHSFRIMGGAQLNINKACEVKAGAVDMERSK